MSRHILRLLSRRGSASPSSSALQGSRYFHANSAAVFQKSHIADVESVRDRVAAIVGDRAVATSEAVRSQHGQDEGPEKGKSPEIVAFPEDVGQVSEICKLCYADSIPIVPHGTGTGLENGTSAVEGGVCVDLTKMEEIEDYHQEDFDVSVRPGVTREGLNHFLKDDGLWFTVDPGANASICGMCATGASGTNTVRYGTIRDNCLNLEVVLPDGGVLYTAGGRDQRPRKSSAGYDLTNLFLGSEGTLGLITRATVKLHAQPEATAAAVVSFPDIQSAVDAVLMTMQCAIPMARLELVDTTSIRASNAYSNLSMKECPTLFLEFHGSESGIEAQTSAVADIARDFGGSDFEWARKQEDRSKLWTARHKLYYAALALRPGSRMVTTDVAVPVTELPQMLLETSKDIEDAGLTGPIFGHVGDGNFHCALLFDPEKPEEYAACKATASRLANRAIARGGTCTGEHGIGVGKRAHLEAQFGPTGIAVMRSIKGAVDPRGIMNPGKILN